MTAVSASPGAAAAGTSPFAGADICAIAGLGLPAGRKGPLFEQDTWDFDHVIGLPAYLKQRNRRLEFTGIRNPVWRTVAKEYCAALLAPRHDPVRELPHAYRNPLTLQTCVLKLGELTRWLNWLTEHGVTALGQVTDWHCEAYAAERSERRGSDGSVIGRQGPAMARAAETVIDLACYRELFSSDAYPPGLRPFGGRAGTTVAGLTRARNGENSTPVVPDDLLRPVLAAALYLVRTIAPEVWPLQQEVRAYLEVGPRIREKYRDPDYADIEAALQRRIAEGRPLDRLPAAKTRERVSHGLLSQDDPLAKVSLDSLAREAGRHCFQWHWLDRLRPAILSAAQAVGVEEPYGRNAPMVTRADGNGETPWTLPIPGHQVRPLLRSLRTACIIVIAAVSGMRASEISELEPVPGLVRYRLASKVIKGQPLGGTDDEWVVTREVFDAIEVAERLAGDAEAGTLLFGRFTFNLMFQCFRSWVNGPAGQRLGLQEIPDGPLNPRMLRRTLAVELAYRPGGLLAAKIQLKHVSCATTEGYAVSPPWRRAVQAPGRGHPRGSQAQPPAHHGRVPAAPAGNPAVRPRGTRPGQALRVRGRHPHRRRRSIPEPDPHRPAGPHHARQARRHPAPGNRELLLVHRPVPGALPETRGHPGRRPAPAGNVRLRTLPAGHPPRLPPASLGSQRRERQGLPRQPQPRPENRANPAGSRTGPFPARAQRDRRGQRHHASKERLNMGRLDQETRRRNEAAIRAAMDRLLRGEIPPGAGCDLKALAQQAGIPRTGFYAKGGRPGPYQHLAEEFERRLNFLRQAGEITDPRDAQIARLKTENARLRERLADQETAIAELDSFKTRAISRLAAQHAETERLRQQRPANVRELRPNGNSPATGSPLR